MMKNQPTGEELIVTLATELAVAMEHYEEDETRWFPEAVKSLQDVEGRLKSAGLEVPEPVRFVLARSRGEKPV